MTTGKVDTLNRWYVLYLGMGAGAIIFAGAGRFYILSAPAHHTSHSRLVTLAYAKSFRTGAAETANDRTIFHFVHPEVMPACQLVLGDAQFHRGSIWDTMPAYLHDHRMEAYPCFDMDPAQHVFQFIGRPDETRHLVLANVEAAISPPWSIHCRSGTDSYTFIWPMAGDNIDYRDVEMVGMGDLR